MNILVVDDEKKVLNYQEKLIKGVVPDCEVFSFINVGDAFEFVKNTPCDVAFLDIRMRGMTGIEMAKKIKDILPNINIIFVTGYSEYGLDAMGVRASGYLLKPITKEDVKIEMENLRHPVSAKKKHRIMIQTFGNFEVFYDGVPVKFKRSSSKELLAYLVDIRGTSATYSEVASILWEDGIYDRSRQKMLNNYISDIKKTFHEIDSEEIFTTNRQSMRVDPTLFDCDYYQFLEGNVPVINSYTGKYMNSYSWAELTIAYLNNKKMNEIEIYMK